MKVLIIDDDVKLQALLSEYLSDYGYTVYAHEEGNNVNARIEEIHPDIILLDIMLPGKNGIDLLPGIRAAFSIPVIMLTAKGDEADRIVGLELGADDYLPKPFNPRELLARMKAVLRRYTPDTGKSADAQPKNDLIRAGSISIDPSSMMMICGEKKLELSKTEFRIMEALMKNPNTVLTRDAIMNSAKGRDFMAFERSIDVHVSKLRAKVEDISGNKNIIKTVWGTGYMYVL